MPEIKIIGKRIGEKLYEELMTIEESENAYFGNITGGRICESQGKIQLAAGETYRGISSYP